MNFLGVSSVRGSGLYKCIMATGVQNHVGRKMQKTLSCLCGFQTCYCKSLEEFVAIRSDDDLTVAQLNNEMENQVFLLII